MLTRETQTPVERAAEAQVIKALLKPPPELKRLPTRWVVSALICAVLGALSTTPLAVVVLNLAALSYLTFGLAAWIGAVTGWLCMLPFMVCVGVNIGYAMGLEWVGVLLGHYCLIFGILGDVWADRQKMAYRRWKEQQP